MYGTMRYPKANAIRPPSTDANRRSSGTRRALQVQFREMVLMFGVVKLVRR